MKYIEYVNQRIREELARQDRAVVFGQNVNAGSCLGGLTRGLQSHGAVRVINTPNIENAQVGFGFGLMINGVSSAFFMKQQDFLLLGIDHLVNTYNFVRQSPAQASFTIVTIVVDLGYQGMQSSLNNFGDFCSIARVPGYGITNRHDADYVLSKHLFSKGFRIIGVNQRMFHDELIEFDTPVGEDQDGGIFHLTSGADATIVCFNFTLPQGKQLRRELMDMGKNCSLFGVASAIPVGWDNIITDIRRTGRAIVIEDSKSVNCCSHQFICSVHDVLPGTDVIYIRREPSEIDLAPNSEIFTINAESVYRQIEKVS